MEEGWGGLKREGEREGVREGEREIGCSSHLLRRMKNDKMIIVTVIISHLETSSSFQLLKKYLDREGSIFNRHILLYTGTAAIVTMN